MRNQAGLCPGFLFHRGQKVFEQDVKSFEVKRLKIIAAAAGGSKCVCSLKQLKTRKREKPQPRRFKNARFWDEKNYRRKTNQNPIKYFPKLIPKTKYQYLHRF